MVKESKREDYWLRKYYLSVVRDIYIMAFTINHKFSTIITVHIDCKPQLICSDLDDWKEPKIAKDPDSPRLFSGHEDFFGDSRTLLYILMIHKLKKICLVTPIMGKTEFLPKTTFATGEGLSCRCSFKMLCQDRQEGHRRESY